MEDKIFVIDLSEDPVLIEDGEISSIDTSDAFIQQESLSTENGTSGNSEVEKQTSASHCSLNNSLVLHQENDIVESETIIGEEIETKNDIAKSPTHYWYATYIFGVIISDCPYTPSCGRRSSTMIMRTFRAPGGVCRNGGDSGVGRTIPDVQFPGCSGTARE